MYQHNRMARGWTPQSNESNINQLLQGLSMVPVPTTSNTTPRPGFKANSHRLVDQIFI